MKPAEKIIKRIRAEQEKLVTAEARIHEYLGQLNDIADVAIAECSIVHGLGGIKFLDVGEAGCHTNTWDGVGFFVSDYEDGPIYNGHPKYGAIKRLCRDLTKRTGMKFYIYESPRLR